MEKKRSQTDKALHEGTEVDARGDIELVLTVEEFQSAENESDDVVFYRSTTSCTTTC